MGSPNGIWTAVSGAMAQSQNVDSISNNLANVNTTGFKKDEPVFKEYLTALERPPSPAIDIPRTAFKDSDFYHTDGAEHAMVNVDRMHTDHGQGNMKSTGATFDMAIDGPGFFAIKTPTGLAFTRAGDFKIDATGKLVTTDGYPLLALGNDAAATGQGEIVAPTEPGRDPASTNPFMVSAEVLNAGANPNVPVVQKSPFQEIALSDVIGQGRKVHISAEGEIFAGSDPIAKLAIAEFADSRLLKKTNSTMYTNPDRMNVPKIADKSRVHQGFLEMSNVSAVTELVNLLKANRMFESNMKAIKAYSDMSAKEANEVGKL